MKKYLEKRSTKRKARNTFGVTKTRPEFTAEANINQIMGRYQRTGQLPMVSRKQPYFEDVSQLGDFKEMAEKVQRGREAFNSLPAAVRARFKNNPAELFQFVADDSNYQEAIKLGLIEKKPGRVVKKEAPPAAEKPNQPSEKEKAS